jgi:hypothetical protein
MRKLTIGCAIAVAAMKLFVGTAHAAIVDFVLVQNQSYLKQDIRLFGKNVGSTTSLPQSPGSDTTTYYGHIYVDITPTTIQLMPGSSIKAAVTGNYAPFDPVSSLPVGPPPVGTMPGNYGLTVGGAFDATLVQYGLEMDFGSSPNFPSSPMVRAGDNFNLAGQATSYIDGRQAGVSNFGSEIVTGSGPDPDILTLYGFGAILFGTNGSDIGSWDGNTLILPVHSTMTWRLTNDFGSIDEQRTLTGQLVAVPYVPEPSSLVLALAGLIGLAVWGWRRRR